MYGRADANHAEIVSGLIALKKYHVIDYRDAGAAVKGHPDLGVWQDSRCALVEIKTDKGKLRPSQIKFIEAHGRRVPIVVVRSLKEALAKLRELKTNSRWRDPIVEAILIAAAKRRGRGQ